MKSLFLSVGHNWGANNPKFPAVKDSGANSNGTSEAKAVADVVDEIQRLGVPGVKLVRVPTGLNLSQRIAWINAQLAKNPSAYPEPFAVEFHMDAGPASAVGASVWYDDHNQYTLGEGKQFLAEYTRVTGIPSRHVNSDLTNRLGNLGFTSGVKCAALLVELGFLTNLAELNVVRKHGAKACVAGFVAMNAK